MSQTRYESEVKHIYYPLAKVYDKLSNLSNLEPLRTLPQNEAAMQALSSQLKSGEAEKLASLLGGMTLTPDTVTLPAAQMGQVTLRIIEREAEKCIKMQAEGLPLEANLWIQLLPEGDNACKMRLTLGAELNFFIKQMVGKKLEGAVEQIADMLARIPYGM